MTLPTPELHTARLRLRPFTDADAASLYALHSSAHVLRYWDFPPWTEPPRAQRFIATCRTIEEEGTGARVAVDRASDGAFAEPLPSLLIGPARRAASISKADIKHMRPKQRNKYRRLGFTWAEIKKIDLRQLVAGPCHD